VQLPQQQKRQPHATGSQQALPASSSSKGGATLASLALSDCLGSLTADPASLALELPLNLEAFTVAPRQPTAAIDIMAWAGKTGAGGQQFGGPDSSINPLTPLLADKLEWSAVDCYTAAQIKSQLALRLGVPESQLDTWAGGQHPSALSGSSLPGMRQCIVAAGSNGCDVGLAPDASCASACSTAASAAAGRCSMTVLGPEASPAGGIVARSRGEVRQSGDGAAVPTTGAKPNVCLAELVWWILHGEETWVMRSCASSTPSTERLGSRASGSTTQHAEAIATTAADLSFRRGASRSSSGGGMRSQTLVGEGCRSVFDGARKPNSISAQVREEALASSAVLGSGREGEIKGGMPCSMTVHEGTGSANGDACRATSNVRNTSYNHRQTLRSDVSFTAGMGHGAAANQDSGDFVRDTGPRLRNIQTQCQ
jgi:hypothetical protein